jgi:hypothetical protein
MLDATQPVVLQGCAGQGPGSVFGAPAVMPGRLIY